MNFFQRLGSQTKPLDQPRPQPPQSNEASSSLSLSNAHQKPSQFQINRTYQNPNGSEQSDAMNKQTYLQNSQNNQQQHANPHSNYQQYQQYQQLDEQDLSVANLRKLYSSLLEEMAPLHHEIGDGVNASIAGKKREANDGVKDNSNSSNKNNKNAWRWKNQGTIIVNGSDDEGYDYSYTPDDSKKSWRLNMGGGGGASRSKSSRPGGDVPGGGSMGGVSGGDWSQDGVRRYYTGGVISTNVKPESSAPMPPMSPKSPVLSVGSMDIHLGTMDGVAISIENNDKLDQIEMESFRTGNEGDAEGTEDAGVADDSVCAESAEEPDNAVGNEDTADCANGESIKKSTANMDQMENTDQMEEMMEINISASSSMEDVALETPHALGAMAHDDGEHDERLSKSPPPNVFQFHSPQTYSDRKTGGKSNADSASILFNLDQISQQVPDFAWRLLSSYAPSGSSASFERQFHHLAKLASSNSSQLQQIPGMDQLQQEIQYAKSIEQNVCEGLYQLGQLVCTCQLKKGQQWIVKQGRQERHRRKDRGDDNKDENMEDSEDVEDFESAEAVFAYFCEKNILPMLVDAALCRPPMLPSSLSSLDSDVPVPVHQPHSPFAGVTFTAAIKSSILHLLSDVVYHSNPNSTPLNLAYLLSNNFMNELIMGILPLDQWLDDGNAESTDSQEADDGKEASALEQIIPPYAMLLRSLCAKVRSVEGRGCIPLLLCQRPKRRTNMKDMILNQESSNSDTSSPETQESQVIEEIDMEMHLPLFEAAVQVFISPKSRHLYDSQGYLVQTTAMNVILNVCRILDSEIRGVLEGSLESVLEETKKFENVGESTEATSPKSPLTSSTLVPSTSLSSSTFTLEQQLIFSHTCQNLISCYQKSVRLLMASMAFSKPNSSDMTFTRETQEIAQAKQEALEEAQSRHAELSTTLLTELRYWLGFVDDLLACDIRSWNVRFCEVVVREVLIKVVLVGLRSGHESKSSQEGRAKDSKNPIASSNKIKSSTNSKRRQEILEQKDQIKKQAQLRASLIFLTQVFGMIEYSPLIRMVAALLLHEEYPGCWCKDDGLSSIDLDGRGNFFVATRMLNMLVTGKKANGPAKDRDNDKYEDKQDDVKQPITVIPGSAEADAGAGGGTSNTSNANNCKANSKVGSRPSSPLLSISTLSPSQMTQIPSSTNNSTDKATLKRSPSNAGNNSEMNHRALETAAAKLDLHEFVEEVEHHMASKATKYCGDMGGNDGKEGRVGPEAGEFIPNPHRLAMLQILEGDHSTEDSILSSMLFATILENDAIDDVALETLGVLVPHASDSVSPYELALAKHLQKDLTRISNAGQQQSVGPSYELFGRSIEHISSLGLMLLQRIISHTWTSGGANLEEESFNDSFQSCSWIQALGTCLTYFASYAQQLSKQDTLTDVFAEIMEEEIGRRYKPKHNAHVHARDEGLVLSSSLQTYFPSNYIDDTNVLTNNFVGDKTKNPSFGSRTQNEIEATQFVTRLLLHLRSLTVCVQELHERFSSLGIANKRWYSEGEALTQLNTIEEADEMILSIGGNSTAGLPDIGTDIDLRGRTYFLGCSASQSNARNSKADLVLVLDPSELFVCRSIKGELNRCTVLCIVDLRLVIASAAAGALLHVAIKKSPKNPTKSETDVIQNGKLTLCFDSSGTSSIVKESLDKFCAAYWSKNARNIEDLLEKCCITGASFSRQLNSASNERGDESWGDFQQATT